ncbi:uncharacterized protein LOC143449159 [Clavelina lepadiformis]|uniref:Uncharacterized protein n=1 Tax=Clavelina lepadiformis TaxID=159417 RepID=A0ABP0GI03_CLALP
MERFFHRQLLCSGLLLVMLFMLCEGYKNRCSYLVRINGYAKTAKNQIDDISNLEAFALYDWRNPEVKSNLKKPKDKRKYRRDKRQKRDQQFLRPIKGQLNASCAEIGNICRCKLRRNEIVTLTDHCLTFKELCTDFINVVITHTNAYLTVLSDQVNGSSVMAWPETGTGCSIENTGVGSAMETGVDYIDDKQANAFYDLRSNIRQLEKYLTNKIAARCENLTRNDNAPTRENRRRNYE